MAEEEVLPKREDIDKVLNLTEKTDKAHETYLEALKYEVDKLADNGELGYSQSISMLVPEVAVEDKESSGYKFIGLSGAISRKESLGVDVTLGNQESGGYRFIEVLYTFPDLESIKELQEVLKDK